MENGCLTPTTFKPRIFNVKPNQLSREKATQVFQPINFDDPDSCKYKCNFNGLKWNIIAHHFVYHVFHIRVSCIVTYWNTCYEQFKLFAIRCFILFIYLSMQRRNKGMLSSQQTIFVSCPNWILRSKFVSNNFREKF